MRFRHYLFLGLLAAAMAATNGCGPSRPPLAAVTGTVTYKGKPLDEGTIVFQPAEGRPAIGKIVKGQIVQVTAWDPNDGSPLGTVKVGIESLFPATSVYEKPKSHIPTKYASPLLSGLTAEIKPGKNTLSFDLQD
jgi:hypothetical protein